ncbi:MAG: hypothetical protein FWE30_03680, partial [Bacteroidales bacterium]|nr:hypothetical protein [Bacteroidales bacterium]
MYNTLDGVTLESDKIEVIELLREMLQEKNCGVVLLSSERYEQEDVNGFIKELRKRYMGDVIDVALSKGKPVQWLPFFNFGDKHEAYKRLNSSIYKNVLENLFEVSIYIDVTVNVTKLIPFLLCIPGFPTFNIMGTIWDIEDYSGLLSFLNQHPSPKRILCSYIDITSLEPTFGVNFSYRISVRFPVDVKQWNHARQILINQTLPVEYVFDVSSNEDCLQAERLIEQHQIEKYQLKPVYTGGNIQFFE